MPEPADKTSLVIIGAWNPGILQPSWLARHAFRKPDTEQIPVTLAFSMAPGTPPKFSMEGITFTPSYDRLVINPAILNVEALNSVEEKTIAILETLPHTPVSAFGENFSFIEENPSRELLQIFELNDVLADHLDMNFELSSTAVSTSLRLEHCTLNLARKFSDGIVRLGFNFHYITSSASDAATQLRGSFERNFRLVSAFLASYNLNVEDYQETDENAQEQIST